MARTRVKAATRKALDVAARAVAEREATEADVIAAGVRAVARQIAPNVIAGSLYWLAPVQFVVEQMAPRVCKAHGLPEGRADDMAAYLLAAFNEYVVALTGDLDVEHFEAWTAAHARQMEVAGG